MEEAVRTAMAVITFSIAGVMDWRTREINPCIWIPLLVIGLILGILRALNGLIIYQIISIIVSLIIVGIVAIIVFLLRLMGGADFLAITAFVAAYPYTPSITTPMYLPYFRNSLSIYNLLCTSIMIMPPIIMVLLIYTLIMIILLLYNTIWNLKHIGMWKGLTMPIYRKIYFILFHKIMDINTLFKKRFYYPVFIPGIIERKSFDVYEDDLEWRKKLKDIPRETIIVASWGLPMVTFFSISTLIYGVLYLMSLYLIGG